MFNPDPPTPLEQLDAQLEDAFTAAIQPDASLDEITHFHQVQQEYQAYEALILAENTHG